MLLPKALTKGAIYRDWLRSLPRLTGRPSLTAIAAEIGVPASTLTRPLRPDDPGTSLPHQSTIDKIVARYGVAPPALQATPIRGLGEDATPFQYDDTDSAMDAAVRALTAGRAAADPWVIKSRALEMAGYLPGDIAIVDLGLAPAYGDLVCAQTEIDLDKGTATTVMRIYERAGASDLLMAASLDPALRKPIPVDRDRVTIRGVIVGMLRPLRTAA